MNKNLGFFIFILALALVPPLTRAEESSPNDFDTYSSSSYSNDLWDPFVEEGFKAFDKGDIIGSLEFLRKAVNMGCHSPLVYFKMALGFETNKSYYSSIQYYELAWEEFKKKPSDHPYYLQFEANYGRALYMMGQVDKAIPVLEKALSKQDDTAWILKLLATYYITKGETEKAAGLYEKLIKVAPKEVNAIEVSNLFTLIARSKLEANLEEEAIAWYKKALSLDGTNAEAKNYLKQKQKEDSNKKVYDMIENM